MRFSLTISVVLVGVYAGSAQSPEDQAKAALALAKAKCECSKPASGVLTWEQARPEALRTGKPIVVSVGLDCTTTCSELRPEFLTAHVATFENDSRKRFVMFLPDAKGQLWRCQEWNGIPAPTDVRQRLLECRDWLKANHPTSSPIPFEWPA